MTDREWVEAYMIALTERDLSGIPPDHSFAIGFCGGLVTARMHPEWAMEVARRLMEATQQDSRFINEMIEAWPLEVRA